MIAHDHGVSGTEGSAFRDPDLCSNFRDTTLESSRTQQPAPSLLDSHDAGCPARALALDRVPHPRDFFVLVARVGLLE